MQVRGGEARGSAAISAPPFSQTSLQIEECCDPPIGIFTSDSRSARGISNTSAELKESHWQADFGVGYDFVPRLMQIHFGVRVAEVSATTTATTNASATATRVFRVACFVEQILRSQRLRMSPACAAHFSALGPVSASKDRYRSSAHWGSTIPPTPRCCSARPRLPARRTAR